MAHRLTSGVAPSCSVPHGHDEVVTVDIIESSNGGLDPATNMLVEFDQVKRRWFEWIDDAVDHSFHLGHSDPLIAYFQTSEPELAARLLVTPGDPTTELRAACYSAKLSAFLTGDNPEFRCRKLTIQETPTNSVEYRPSEERKVVPSGEDHWWNRRDMSINDLSAN
jgi:6-pyruvoyltetrahydropterin/6-carboxytetrahydropterin synthase